MPTVAPVGEGRAADRACLAEMRPFRRRGSNLWARYGAVADLGRLQWEPSLSAYRDHYRTLRARGEIAYTVVSYRTPIAWVKVTNGYPERIHTPRNPCWSRTTNNHRATTYAALGIDTSLITAQYNNRYVFADHVYRMRDAHAVNEAEAARVRMRRIDIGQPLTFHSPPAWVSNEQAPWNATIRVDAWAADDEAPRNATIHQDAWAAMLSEGATRQRRGSRGAMRAAPDGLRGMLPFVVDDEMA